jgi:hypothetical protein
VYAYNAKTRMTICVEDKEMGKSDVSLPAI